MAKERGVLSTEYTDIDPYKAFSNGIVKQAVKDYRKARKKLNKEPENQPALIMKSECEKFFLGEWFFELTDVDGKTLLRKLSEEGVLSDKARSV